MNKLQARVRYTHITCRYLWINHPELLIARDVLTAPNAGKPLPARGRTLRIPPPPPWLNPSSLQSPSRSHREPSPPPGPGSRLLLGYSADTPPSRSGPDVQGGNLYKHCTFDLCVQSLTHTPSHTNILYTHRKTGIEYKTTNLLHSCNINMKSQRLYL